MALTLEILSLGDTIERRVKRDAVLAGKLFGGVF